MFCLDISQVHYICYVLCILEQSSFNLRIFLIVPQIMLTCLRAVHITKMQKWRHNYEERLRNRFTHARFTV